MMQRQGNDPLVGLQFVLKFGMGFQTAVPRSTALFIIKSWTEGSVNGEPLEGTDKISHPNPQPGLQAWSILVDSIMAIHTFDLDPRAVRMGGVVSPQSGGHIG